MATLFARHPDLDRGPAFDFLLMLVGALLAWLLWPGLSS
jgi:hypothetical protein